MFVQSRKGYHKSGILVEDITSLNVHYLISRRFLLDLAGLVPVDYVLWAFYGIPRPVLRLNRLLKTGRLLEFLDRTWHISVYPRLTLLTGQLSLLMVIMHWNACLYYQMSKFLGFDSDAWVFSLKQTPKLPEKYLRCFYWVAMMLTTIGEVPRPIRVEEYVFVTINVLVGIIVFATMIGNIGSLISSAGYQKTQFQSWGHQVKEYMRQQETSETLQLRVTNWFEHFWSENHSSPVEGNNSPLAMLPEKLQAEINMNAHLMTLRKVKIFQDCEPGLLIKLVNRMRLVMVNPGELLFRKGDVGKEMFIIKSGKLEIIAADRNQTVLATLSASAVFGELSLLNISGMKSANRRTASCRSKGYSYLFSLSKEDLWAALEDYPDARVVMIDKARQILIKDGLLDTSVESSEFARLQRSGKIAILQRRVDRLVERMSVTVAGMTWQIRSNNDRLQKMEHRLTRWTDGRLRRISDVTLGPGDEIFLADSISRSDSKMSSTTASEVEDLVQSVICNRQTLANIKNLVKSESKQLFSDSILF